MEELVSHDHHLSSLTTQINSDPAFRAEWVCGVGDVRGFVRVTSSTWPSRCGPLVYVPAFHAVVTSTEASGGSEVRIELVNFQGRSLAGDHAEVVSSVSSSGWSSSRVLSDLGRMHLCCGVHTTPVDAGTAHDVHKEMVEAMSKDMFLEMMHQVRVARSQRCKYAVYEPQTMCSECQKVTDRSDLLAKVKAEPLEPDATIKVSPKASLQQGKGFRRTSASKPPPDTNIGSARLALLTGMGSISIKASGDDLGGSVDTVIKKPDKEEVDEGSDGGGGSVMGDDYVDNDDITVESEAMTMKVNPFSITVVKDDGEAAPVDFDKIRADFNEAKLKKTEESAAIRKKNKKRKVHEEDSSKRPPKRKAAAVAATKNAEIDANDAGKADDKSGEPKEGKKKAASGPPPKIHSEKNCPICNEPFKDVNSFMAHLGKCSIPESSEEEIEEVMDENGEKVMRKKKKFRDATTESKTAKDFKCRICCEVLKSTQYKNHKLGHEKKFKLSVEVQCPQCPTQIVKRDLNPHFLRVHPDAGGACCIECLKVVPQSELKVHLAKEHGAHKPKDSEGQLCPMCGKRCYFTADLELHLATHHLPPADPPQPEEAMCHVCGKVFSHRYKLKQHVSNIHNKTYKHVCPFCQKAFNLRHQLNKHLLTHSDLKPFKCKYCDYKNSRKYRVQKHVQKAHQGEGTEDDMELLGGTAKTSEFVHNMFGL